MAELQSQVARRLPMLRLFCPNFASTYDYQARASQLIANVRPQVAYQIEQIYKAEIQKHLAEHLKSARAGGAALTS